MMREPWGNTNFELFEPRLKDQPPEVVEMYKRSFEAAEEIQKMFDHPLYRAGDWIYRTTGVGSCLAESLYDAGMHLNRLWKRATFRE